MNLIIILAIFLVPLASAVTIKGTIIWYPQLLALQLIGGLCFASRFWQLNKWLAVFITYLSFSYIYVTSASPRTLLCLMIGYMAISVTLAVSRLKSLRWVYISLVVMTALNILYPVLQSLGVDPIFTSINGRWYGVVGVLGSHDQLALYAAANGFWSPWLMLLVVVPIFLSRCNSALIGLVSGAAIYTFFRYGWRKLCYGLLGVLILVVPWWHYCHKSNDELSERFRLWKLTINQLITGKIQSCDLEGRRSLIKANPLWGFGLGNFFVFSPFSQYKMWGLDKTDLGTRPNSQMKKIPHFYEHAHNDLLEAFYELGYVGFAVLVAVVIGVVRLFVVSVKSPGVVATFSSLLSQAVASMGVYVFHAPVSLFMFCLTLGLFYAEVRNAQPPKVV